MKHRRRHYGTFHRLRVEQSKSSELITSTLVASFFILFAVWFIFISGHYSVTDIQIHGLQSISRGEVVSSTYAILDTDKNTWNPWDKRNIFFINTDDLAQKLKDYLFAENVTVKKFYPNILRLKIQERQRSVIIASNNQLLNVDTNGIVTSKTHGDEANRVRLLLRKKTLADASFRPVVAVNLSEMVTNGYQITNTTTVKLWIDSYRALVASGMKFRYLGLSTVTSTKMYAISNNGIKIFFDLKEPLQPQIETYQKFMASKPRTMHIYRYVDVRIPGKLYIE